MFWLLHAREGQIRGWREQMKRYGATPDNPRPPRACEMACKSNRERDEVRVLVMGDSAREHPDRTLPPLSFSHTCDAQIITNDTDRHK